MKKQRLSIEDEQKMQLSLLQFFDEICKKEHLNYYLAYGTLLGAVREAGFIQWDDDIDLWMPVADVRKFCSVYEKYKNELYFLQTYETDKKCLSPEMVRICINGTYKWPLGSENEKFHTGIYLDIFPLCRGGDHDENVRHLKKSVQIHNRIFGTLKKILPNTLKGKVSYLRNHLVPRRLLSWKLVRLINKHDSKTGQELLSFPAAYAGLNRSLFKAELFEGDPVYITFEHLSLPCPRNYDTLLTQMYGEYMVPAKTKPYYTEAYILEM